MGAIVAFSSVGMGDKDVAVDTRVRGVTWEATEERLRRGLRTVRGGERSMIAVFGQSIGSLVRRSRGGEMSS